MLFVIFFVAMNPSRSLCDACCEGDDDKVLHWIRGGASVNKAGGVDAASNVFEGIWIFSGHCNHHWGLLLGMGILERLEFL